MGHRPPRHARDRSEQVSVGDARDLKEPQQGAQRAHQLLGCRDAQLSGGLEDEVMHVCGADLGDRPGVGPGGDKGSGPVLVAAGGELGQAPLLAEVATERRQQLPVGAIGRPHGRSGQNPETSQVAEQRTKSPYRVQHPVLGPPDRHILSGTLFREPADLQAGFLQPTAQMDNEPELIPRWAGQVALCGEPLQETSRVRAKGTADNAFCTHLRLLSRSDLREQEASVRPA